MDRLAFQLIGRREFLREIAGLGISALARTAIDRTRSRRPSYNRWRTTWTGDPGCRLETGWGCRRAVGLYPDRRF